MSDPVQRIQEVLRNSLDSTPEKVATFFKTGPGEYAQHDQFIGITVPTLRKIAKRFISITLEDLGLLIRSPINEDRLLALIILTQHYKAAPARQKEEIYHFYRANLTQVNNWNLVDSSAHLIMGAHLFECECSVLEDLAHSHTVWERRIAMVATWYFIRHARLERTFRIAKVLLKDPHDLIHKAVGWMLREAGKKDEGRLMAFLFEYAHHMPKTMLRYAMERLSKEQRAGVAHTVHHS